MGNPCLNMNGRKAAKRSLSSIGALGLVAGLSVLSGCASLPSSGPTARQIEQGIVDANALGIQIIDITAETRPVHVSDASEAPSALALTSESGTIDMVGPGDVLQVTVFEIGTALFTARGGLALASADVNGSAPVAAGESLPPIKVDQRGGVTLPYVGRIAVAGMTPAQIQTAITQRLKPNSQYPQAVVSVREQVWSTIMVSGEVKQPGRVALSLRSERLLDAITKAGGSSVPAQDTLVRITRSGHSGSVWLDELTTVAANNILVMPQDQIELLHRPRTFTVLGATDKVSEMPFLRPDVSLAEAIARAGGPSDNRADSSAVFVFRYDRVFVDGRPMPNAKPLVYRLDLSRPESYFLAQTFWMRPRDVIYFANAPSVQPAKLLQILNLIFQPIYTAKVLAQ